MQPSVMLSVIVNGLLLGGVYALVSLGLMLAWGTARIINLAHGSLVVLGSYIALSLYEAYGLHPLLALPLAALTGFAMGYILYHTVFHRVAENEVSSLLATFGLGLMLYALMLAVWGPDARSIPWATGSAVLAGVYIPLGKLYSTLSALALISVFHLALYKTSIGRAMRAMAQSFEAARIVGVEPRRVGAIAFGLALAAALASGVIITGYTSFTPDSGGVWLVVSLAVVALAGLRNVAAMLAGGVVLGLASQMAGFALGSMFEEIVPMLLIVILFSLSPQGLFARLQVRRV